MAFAVLRRFFRGLRPERALSPLGQPVENQDVARVHPRVQACTPLSIYDVVVIQCFELSLPRSAAAETACLAEKRPELSSGSALLLFDLQPHRLALPRHSVPREHQPAPYSVPCQSRVTHQSLRTPQLPESIHAIQQHTEPSCLARPSVTLQEIKSSTHKSTVKHTIIPLLHLIIMTHDDFA